MSLLLPYMLCKMTVVCNPVVYILMNPKVTEIREVIINRPGVAGAVLQTPPSCIIQ